MFREEFTRELQTIIHESRIRQNIIAQALDLSPAALSQFMHGTVLPARRQLLSLLDLLCIPPEQAELMCAKLNAAKREMTDTNALPPLDPHEEPDDENPPLDDRSDGTSLSKLYRQQSGNGTVVFMESPIKTVPVVYLDEFIDFVPEKISVTEFANARQHDAIIRDYGSIVSPVMIKTIGSRIGINYTGMVSIVIAPNLSFDSTEFYLAGFSGKMFRILPRSYSQEKKCTNTLFPTEDISEIPLWKLPIIELTITPFNLSQHKTKGFL